MTEDMQQRMQWWLDARFGMFVHWGMYSVLGLGEQIMSRDMMPLAEYEPYAQQFQPPEGWATRLAQRARRAGAKYVVLTSRHHDGYCLFDTATHDFNAARTGPGRDLIAEYVDAVREAGLGVGLYYSVMNWRWPGFWDAEAHPEDLPRMVDELHAQVRELMTGYGKIDILWYDVCAVPGKRSPGAWGGTSIDQTPAEFWRSEQLNAMVRELQPHILINNRAGVPEDFGTPEQRIGGEGEGRAWESCMTLNYAPGWGYLRFSSANKTPAEVLYNLVDAVRLGGNFLFNVGPKSDGSIDEREGVVLNWLGDWMDLHGEAVYGTRPEKIYDLSRGHVQGPMYHYGMWTCKGKRAWFIMFRYPGSELVVSSVGPRIVSAKLMPEGKPLTLEPTTNSRTRIKGLPDAPPNPLAPVIEVEFEEPPYAVGKPGAEWLHGTA